MFDEFEEWHLIQGHYCIAFASQDKQAAGEESLVSNFGLVVKESPRVYNAFID